MNRRSEPGPRKGRECGRRSRPRVSGPSASETRRLVRESLGDGPRGRAGGPGHPYAVSASPAPCSEPLASPIDWWARGERHRPATASPRKAGSRARRHQKDGKRPGASRAAPTPGFKHPRRVAESIHLARGRRGLGASQKPPEQPGPTTSGERRASTEGALTVEAPQQLEGVAPPSQAAQARTVGSIQGRCAAALRTHAVPCTNRCIQLWRNLANACD
jgi:hypothetical protein